MEEIFEEYVTFHVTASDGSDVEMAVVDEFDFEDKHYVVGAVVTGIICDNCTYHIVLVLKIKLINHSHLHV